MLAIRGTEADLAQAGDDCLLSSLADGWRSLVWLDDRVRIRARGGTDLSPRLPALAAELARLRPRAGGGATVLDANLVLPAAAGESGPALEEIVALEVLDVLCSEGRAVTAEPLVARQARLRRLAWPQDGPLRPVPTWRGDARAALRQLDESGVAGRGALLVRRAASPYRPGLRSRDWLAFGERELAEMLLCGVAAGGALVLGVPTPHGLVFGGLTWPSRVWRLLAARCTEAAAPFPEPAIWPSLRPVVWARPELWLAVESDVRPGSGRGGPRWRFVRVQEDLSPPPPAAFTLAAWPDRTP
jgi:ATP-dependent DNA ligase